MYSIKYLSTAKQDLKEIGDYIFHTLKAPVAAINIIKELRKSIVVLEQFPFAYQVYRTKEKLEEEYHILPVKNYLVLYVVSKNIVEIRRIIYAKMDIGKITL